MGFEEPTMPTPEEVAKSKVEDPLDGLPVITEEQIIDSCLLDKRIGFVPISVMGTEQLFQKAPQGETFTVPDKRFKTTYENRAKALNRKDLKFVVE